MDSLNIAGKAVRLCIDNDESRVIEFYPTDVSFAPGTAQTVFGSRDSVAMAARFFRGVTPYIRKARQGELDRYLKEPAEDVME